jgi:hypothetical protein
MALSVSFIAAAVSMINPDKWYPLTDQLLLYEETQQSQLSHQLQVGPAGIVFRLLQQLYYVPVSQ